MAEHSTGRFDLGEYRKLVVTIVAFLVTVASVALEGNLIPEAALPYVVAGIAVAGSYGVWRLPNKQTETY